MIQANELRIGNWVLDDGEPGIISSIGSGGISFYTINGFNCNRETGSVLQSGIDKFKPLPITHEILDKCGFEKIFDVDTGEDQINGYYIYRSDQHYQFKVFLNQKNHCCVHYLKVAMSKHPQFLHEFQNLVYAFTGKELNINLWYK